MTDLEALKILTDHTPRKPPYFDPDFVKALKLGIEALALKIANYEEAHK